LIPIASFLAGALLSLLLPVLLLIALTVWYIAFIRRVPETGEPEPARAAANPGPDAPAAAAAGSAPGDG
jgi:hypothetical protein